MTAWLVIAAVAAGTYAFRTVTFVLLGSRQLPSWTDRPFAVLAPAAIAALVASMVLTDHGRLDPVGLPEACSLVAVLIVVSRNGSIGRGMVIGFATLWALSAVGT